MNEIQFVFQGYLEARTALGRAGVTTIRQLQQRKWAKTLNGIVGMTDGILDAINSVLSSWPCIPWPECEPVEASSRVNRWRISVFDYTNGIYVGDVTFIAHSEFKAAQHAVKTRQKALSRRAIASRVSHAYSIVRKQELMSLLA